MTLVNGKEVFEQCEHPFYKDMEVKQDTLSCTLYSNASSFKQSIQLPFMNYEAAIHQLSLAIIQLRSHELWNQQQEIIEKAI